MNVEFFILKKIPGVYTFVFHTISSSALKRTTSLKTVGIETGTVMLNILIDYKYLEMGR
jgi:hypothetical protein